MTNFNDPKDRGSKYNILIASYLEPEYVNRIRQVDDRINVFYEPELLQPPRYPADHKGNQFWHRSEGEAYGLQHTHDKYNLHYCWWSACSTSGRILFDGDVNV